MRLVKDNCEWRNDVCSIVMEMSSSSVAKLKSSKDFFGISVEY